MPQKNDVLKRIRRTNFLLKVAAKTNDIDKAIEYDDLSFEDI